MRSINILKISGYFNGMPSTMAFEMLENITEDAIFNYLNDDCCYFMHYPEKVLDEIDSEYIFDYAVREDIYNTEHAHLDLDVVARNIDNNKLCKIIKSFYNKEKMSYNKEEIKKLILCDLDFYF